MNPNFFTDAAGRDCDAIQQQISDAADSGGPLSAEVQTHVAACAGCAFFAEQWLHGPPDGLTGVIPAVAATPELRERILDRQPNAAPGVVRFTQPPEMTRRASWSTWVGRIAAGVLLVGFSYWLLDPRVAPPVPMRPTTAATPTLSQGLTRLEAQSKAEREAVRTALVGGGRRVGQQAEWTLSALEL